MLANASLWRQRRLTDRNLVRIRHFRDIRLTRLELGRDNPGHRSTIFGDLGWVGNRDRLKEIGRPLSGVGYGESMFDGIFRVDVSRGLYPRRQWRFDVYLEGRF